MHLVDSLEFDVALASEERAFAEQEQLQAFLRGPALRVIESVFDQVSSEARARMAGQWPTGPSAGRSERRHGPAWTGAAEVWRLDRLEIDLGPVHGPDLCGQWERRLRDRLLEQLRDRLLARPAAAPGSAPTHLAATAGAVTPMRPRHTTPGGSAAPGAPAIPATARWLPPTGETPQAPAGNVIVAGAQRQADLGALQHYLEHGCLPWHLTWPAGRSFSAWAQGVVLRDAPALARQLRRAEPEVQQRLTRRLAEQLAPAGLERLAQALGLPGHWPLAGWVDAMAEGAGPAGPAGGAVASGTLTRRLWTTVLDEALQAPASARDAQTLLAALRMTARGLVEAAAARTSQPSPSPGDKARGETVAAPAVSPSASPQTTLEAQPAAAALRLRARLRLLEQGHQSQGLDAALRDGLRSDPAALAAWAVEVGQSAAARRWLAAGLATDTWQRLLALLAPTVASTYGPLLRRRPLGAAWMQLARSDWTLTRTRLREAALAAVLLDPPATASDPAGLHALARHAAALLNVEATSVSAVWSGPAGRRMPLLGLNVVAFQAPEQPQRAAALTARTPPAIANHVPGRPSRPATVTNPSAEASTTALALAADLEHAMLAGHADAQPRLDNADRARLAAWLAQGLRTASARERWVGSLGASRLQDLAAQVAPAEAPWLKAWTADSMWPLWSATGLHARAGSTSSFWTLWWGRWAASRTFADPGLAVAVDADATPGAGFDRAGFVDAWLRHVARRHGLRLPIYLPGLAARLKSLQRQQRRSRPQTVPGTGAGLPSASAHPARYGTPLPTSSAAGSTAAVDTRQAGSTRRQPPRSRLSEHDDPVALVLRRARALANVPDRREGSALRVPHLWADAPPVARSHAAPALGLEAASPEACTVVSASADTDHPNTPQTLRSDRRSPRQEQPDTDLRPAAESSSSATADWTWLIQNPGRLLPAQRPAALKASLEAALSDPAFADELVRRAPPALWPLLLAWLRPAACGSVMAAVAGAAALSPADDRGRSAASQAASWRQVLQHYFVEGRPHLPGEFERRLARSDRPGARPEPVGREAAKVPVTRALASRPPGPTCPAGLQVGQAVQVHNAGIVLLGAYAPRLFSMLGLTDGRAFVDADAAARAVHLLQWLVDERSDREEYLLVLNKLLCGLPLATPLPREVALQAREQDAGQQMLQAVISHWNALGGTSVQGLRETFLQREGRLQRDEDAWRLRVAPRPFDMLLDRLPWGYATLKLPWMKEVLHVDWR